MNKLQIFTALLIGVSVSACSDAPSGASSENADMSKKSSNQEAARKDNSVSKFAILAFSWQPAFCEKNAGKPECATQTEDRFDAQNFTLHGLWPKGAYCDVEPVFERMDKDGAWGKLEPLQLEPATRAELKRVMPGYQSNLQRHEWIKHGTCYGNADAQEYYADSLALMRQLNGSELQKLFAANIGQRVSREEIRDAMDASFGKGAGLRARVKCKKDQNSNRSLITEITIALSGEITEQSKLSDLLLAARPDNKEGCPGGIVDPAGLQ